ncbi:hypothetical protein niasHT_036452 [Heterodera trifolii]|uniref:Uncharacterized protein n=1 Tax=Heterodera trifolii TaxID=157864 RepID=A0ABD2IX97_9BILA
MNLHIIFSLLLCALVLCCTVGKSTTKKGQKIEKGEILTPAAGGSTDLKADGKGTTAGGKKANADTGTTELDGDVDDDVNFSAAGGEKATAGNNVGSDDSTELEEMGTDNSKDTDEAENPEGSTASTVTGDTFTKVNKFADEVTECEFYFVHLKDLNANEKQKLWERTKKEAETDIEELEEDGIDYRIVSPAISKDQPDMNKFYEQDTDDLPSDPTALRKEEYLAADNVLEDSEFIEKILPIFKEKPIAMGYLNGTKYDKTKVGPYFRKAVRLMKHRFCLFSLMTRLRNSGKEQHLKYMPGFVSHNKKVSAGIRKAFTSSSTKSLRHKQIETEYAMYQTKESSTVSLHGSLVGEDGQAVYFSIWTKNAPGTYINCPEDKKSQLMRMHMSRGKRQANDVTTKAPTMRGGSTKAINGKPELRCFSKMRKQTPAAETTPAESTKGETTSPAQPPEENE